MNTDVLSTVRRLARDIADRDGYELVDVIMHPEVRRLVISVFIHNPQGVSVEDCKAFSESLVAAIEAEEAVSGSWILEVSSPGLNRPLKTISDFIRNRGREIEVSRLSGEGRVSGIKGTIEDVSGDIVLLRTGNQITRLSLDEIKKAKPVIDWKELFRTGEKRSHPEETRNE